MLTTCSHRNDYKRFALSQILVRDLADALKVSHALRGGTLPSVL